jgi:hypothetical protein
MLGTESAARVTDVGYAGGAWCGTGQAGAQWPRRGGGERSVRRGAAQKVVGASVS